MTGRFFSALSAMLLCITIVGEAKAEETLCEGLLKVYRSGKTGFYDLIERRLAEEEIDPEIDLPGTFEPNYYLPGTEKCGIGPLGRYYRCSVGRRTESVVAQSFIRQTFADIKSCFVENEPGDWSAIFDTSDPDTLFLFEPSYWTAGMLYADSVDGEHGIMVSYDESSKHVMVWAIGDVDWLSYKSWCEAFGREFFLLSCWRPD